jgi:hypothetical protein
MDEIEVDLPSSGEWGRNWKRYVRMLRVSHSANLPAVTVAVLAFEALHGSVKTITICQ